MISDSICLNNQNLSVSVIMNCYNGDKYLREAIDSVYAQTFTGWEIIFWDNASTDNSAKIANSYDDRLKYYRGDVNVPLGQARNKAIEKATGEYVAFLDCDDIWLPDKLDQQIAAMSNSKFSLCYGGLLLINSSGDQIGRSQPKEASGNILNQLLFQFDVNLPTAFIRKSALDKSNLAFDDNLVASEDYGLFMQLAVENEYVVISKPLAKYRIHDGALTNKSISHWAIEREYTLSLMQIKHPGVRECYNDGFTEAFARARYYRARYYMFLGKRDLAQREMVQNIFIDKRYFLLFLLSLLPTVFWNYGHLLITRRSSFG